MNLSKDLVDDLIRVYVAAAIKQERERCAQIAETAGLGEPHTMPPYNVREYIAKEIRGNNNGK